MAKVQRVRFHESYHEGGAVKFLKGEHYPLTPQGTFEALQNHASVITVDMDSGIHEAETAAAHAAWNAQHARTIDADRTLRGQADPAATLVESHLAQLRARGVAV